MFNSILYNQNQTGAYVEYCFLLRPISSNSVVYNLSYRRGHKPTVRRAFFTVLQFRSSPF